MQISKTRELKITCMHNSRQYIQHIQRNLTFCINMNLMNRPNRHWTVPPGKTAKFRVMPVIQWRSVAWFLISNNGAHVQIFWSAAGAHQMEPPSPLISWVNPFPSRFINRTACFPRKVSYFRESRVSPWENKIGWSRTQKPVFRPFSFIPLRPFLQFYSRWDLGIMK